MHDDEFRDLSDDELAVASNFLRFSPTPDDLQSLASLGSNQQKAFLNPQELIANVGFPDSPNGSLPDSSSDSTASVKRTGSCTPAKTPAADIIATDELDDTMDWGNRDIPDLSEDDPAYPFTREDEALDMTIFPGFGGDREDTFMGHAFDFPPAPSGNLDNTPSSLATIPSPSMPAIKTNNSANVDLPIPTHDGHQKKNSVRECNFGDLADPGLTIFTAVLSGIHGTNQRGVARIVANVEHGN